jgi:hypothetical protein
MGPPLNLRAGADNQFTLAPFLLNFLQHQAIDEDKLAGLKGCQDRQRHSSY